MAARPSDFDTRVPFTRAAAIAAGIDPRLLRGSRFRRIFRGVYVAAGVHETALLRGQAAIALFRSVSAFASHATAARIHGVPLPVLPDEHVSVFRAADRRAHAGVCVHVARSAMLVEIGGIRVSSYRQMFVELATLLTLVDLVVVGDNLVRRGLVTPGALAEFCAARPASGRAPGSSGRGVRAA